MIDRPVALVTGGSRGIGLGITKALLSSGYGVAMLATRPRPAGLLEALTELGPVRYFQGSVADPACGQAFVDDATKAWDRLDLFVSNAGVAPLERQDILDMTIESYDRVMDINLRGSFMVTQSAAKAMIRLGAASPRQSIIVVSSISAITVSLNRAEYCLSKAGLAMMTQLFAARLAPAGIGVYEIRPGVIATDMTAGVKDRYDQLIADGLIPAGRWGQPADVGAVVAMLAASDVAYATGSVIDVAGAQQIPQL